MLELREALEASWDTATAYAGAFEAGNPALGQCYPTSWLVQQFYPEAEIVEGKVWTGKSIETHFWNVLLVDGKAIHIDFTWQQFPTGSVVRSFRIRDRETLNDGPATKERCRLLRERVVRHLTQRERATHYAADHSTKPPS